MTSELQKDPAYFGYYAQFIHQQNMLQDNVRTSAYYNAIQNKAKLIKDKVVMDVGAGSGILSYFALQAGAKNVYAVEASDMSKHICTMRAASAKKNKWMSNDKLKVLSKKVEEVDEHLKVDFIVSEPIGVLIVHERMMESFLYARDHFLRPGGTLMPNAGSIYLAPFSDANLWSQTKAKSRFWESESFYGVDFSPLSSIANEEVFGQPVVGSFDSRILLAPAISHAINFETVSVEDLKHFKIDICWSFPYTGIIHGIAGWFDIDLCGLNLPTGPNSPTTHWQQVRFLLREPLAVNAFETVKGYMKLDVNEHRSYSIETEIYVVSRDNQGIERYLNDELNKNQEGEEEEQNGKQSSQFLRREDEKYFRLRRDQFNLHQQTYWFESTLLPETSQPEHNCMYEPYVQNGIMTSLKDEEESKMEF